MVRLIIIFSFTFLLCGCKKQIQDNYDQILSYHNFLEAENIPIELDSFPTNLISDTIDAANLSKYDNLIEIKGPLKNFILRKVEERHSYGVDDFTLSEISSSTTDTPKIDEIDQVLFAGRFLLNDSIKSICIIICSDNLLEQKIYNTIFLFNMKNNKLTSFAELSYSRISYAKTLIKGNQLLYSSNMNYFSICGSFQEDTKDLTIPFEGNHGITIESFMRFINELSLISDKKKLFYSGYYIDNIGFVRLADKAENFKIFK